MIRPKRACIVCGRDIKPRTSYVAIQPMTGWSPNEDGPRVDITKKSDCNRFTNYPLVISTQRNGDGFITGFYAWDGESYSSKYFCTNQCAMAQGQASAEHGHRYRWTAPPAETGGAA